MATETAFEFNKVGFIGGGVMASALARGIVANGMLSPDRIVISNPEASKRDVLALQGFITTPDNREVVQSAQVIIVAVKPDVVRRVLIEIAQDLTPAHLIISIAAGVSISSMHEIIPSEIPLVRVMPNTPCLVGQCAAAYVCCPSVHEPHMKVVEDIFRAVGVISKVPEKLMDAVTALSGSGPAFVFMMIEALADGGVRAGLPRAVAMQLAAQTVKGAACMVLETGRHPGELKDQVCSPGGTTIAGVEALENASFRAAAMGAVTAAARRANELRELNK